jgi:hypothetical protein
MTALNHDTIPAPPPDSGEHAAVRIEASPISDNRSPQYVDSVLHELRQAVARARCPVHYCRPALAIDFSSSNAGALDVTAHNCCSKLDEMVARALWVYPLFRLILPR